MPRQQPAPSSTCTQQPPPPLQPPHRQQTRSDPATCNRRAASSAAERAHEGARHDRSHNHRSGHASCKHATAGRAADAHAGGRRPHALPAAARRFEYLINLGDADLTVRTHGEIASFFGAFPGRSILSVVESKRDPRRYKMHAGFRGYCWVECDEGAAGGS